MRGEILVVFIISGAITERITPEKVLGGSDAQDGQFPYQVSLRIGGSHVCGGTIISDNFILTAAHCVEKVPNQE